MEEWQKKHITSKLRELITTTILTSTFLSNLLSDGQISAEEKNSGCPIDQAMKFYQIIQTRKDSYNLLKQALRDTCQSGAYAILDECNQHNNTLPYKNFGTISYRKDVLLGRGCYNTKVFLGMVEDRLVAVKLINTEDIYKDKAMKEVDILKRLYYHENIVRYFRAEITEDYILIAIELCDTNLHDWIVKPVQENRIEIPVVDVLKQATNGIAHLHMHNIVHRDLKPANILLVKHAIGVVQVKISDFGLSKKIPDGKSRLSRHTSGIGTEGWMAPEIIRVLEKEQSDNVLPHISLGSDIFSLGCIYYFVLTGGLHPFGGPIMRSANILFGKHHLDKDQIKAIEFGALGFIWLIKHMISHDDRERPSASSVLNHHVFWSGTTTQNFLDDISPYIRGCAGMLDESSDLVSEQLDWVNLTCQTVQEFIKPVSGLDASKMSNLLQVVVSMKRNRLNLPQPVRDALGNNNNLEDFFIYWRDRFPLLVPIVWTCFQHLRNKNGTIARYYQEEKHFRFSLMSQSNCIWSKVDFPLNQIPKKLEEQEILIEFKVEKRIRSVENSSENSQDETRNKLNSPEEPEVGEPGSKPDKPHKSKWRISFRKKLCQSVSLKGNEGRDEKQCDSPPPSSSKGPGIRNSQIKSNLEKGAVEKHYTESTAGSKPGTSLQFKLQRTKDRQGNTQLHRAIREQNDDELVKYLVENGADLNAQNKQMPTPLQQAYMCGDTEFRLRILKYLIDNEGDVMLNNVKKDTFVHKLLRQITLRTAYHGLLFCRNIFSLKAFPNYLMSKVIIR